MAGTVAALKNKLMGGRRRRRSVKRPRKGRKSMRRTASRRVGRKARRTRRRHRGGMSGSGAGHTKLSNIHNN